MITVSQSLSVVDVDDVLSAIRVESLDTYPPFLITNLATRDDGYTIEVVDAESRDVLGACVVTGKRMTSQIEQFLLKGQGNGKLLYGPVKVAVIGKVRQFVKAS